MSKFALIACVFLTACGPTDDGRGTGSTGGKGDGGTTNCGTKPKDTDGDGISDKDEGAEEKPARDTDCDGTPDFMDQDSDGDGIPDSIEGRNGNPCSPPVDTDGDGKPDFRDLDSDDANDATVGDNQEAGADTLNPIDTDSNGAPDYMDKDNDGDGILDIFELTPPGTATAVTLLAAAPDTDGDNTPDFRDIDSDADTILDNQEGVVDTDGDLIGNWRDLDSDGDCVPDAAEAGDSDQNTMPVDTDMDGAPDFEDTDSDNDGLTDGKEDKSCDGILNSCETNRLIADSDGDTVSDLIEYIDCSIKPPSVQLMTNCQCDGSDGGKSPLSRGDFVFVSDYMVPPVPDKETLNLTTDVSRADVVFAMDVTGSMGDCSKNIANNIGKVIVPGVKAKVSDVAYGVMTFRDFNDKATYPGVIRYDYRIQTVRTAASLDDTNNQSVAFVLKNNVTSGGGDDGPEAGWEALYALVADPMAPVKTGGGGTLGSYTSATNAIAPAAILTGEEQGTIAQGKFRAGAIPIIVAVSDVEWHDKPGTAAVGEAGKNNYDGAGASATDCPNNACANVPSRQDVVDRVNAIGGHVIGLARNGGATTGAGPKARFYALAQATGAIVQPTDFVTRPTNCGAGQCCTGNAGAGEAPAGGTDCPLSYSIVANATDPCPVSDAIVDGIAALSKALKFDVHVEAKDVDAGTVDNFIEKLVPNITGSGTAALCVVVSMSQLVDNFNGPKAVPGPPLDGIMDTFIGLSGAVQICFDVVAKQNNTIVNTAEPQIFRAQLQVIGQTKTNNVTNNFNLGTPREVFFLVPPVIINGPIN